MEQPELVIILVRYYVSAMVTNSLTRAVIFVQAAEGKVFLLMAQNFAMVDRYCDVVCELYIVSESYCLVMQGSAFYPLFAWRVSC